MTAARALAFARSAWGHNGSTGAAGLSLVRYGPWWYFAYRSLNSTLWPITIPAPRPVAALSRLYGFVDSCPWGRFSSATADVRAWLNEHPFPPGAQAGRNS